MSWEIKNNVISKLYIDGKNVILPWGFETADISSFFSMEDGVGYRYKLENFKQSIGEDKFKTELTNNMLYGKWTLKCDETLLSNGVHRKIRLECLEDSVFMDFVMRFRFLKEYFSVATINDTKYEHQNTNIYYQFPVRHVELDGIKKISIDIKNVIHPKSFSPEMYVRDRDDEWIIHARMIPIEGGFEVIKMCSKWFQSRPLPLFVSKLLLKSKWIRKELWYRGERRPFKNRIMRVLCPSAFSMLKLEKGSILEWDVEMRWN